MTDVLNEEANAWLLRLNDDAPRSDRADHAKWLAQSPAHEEAWTRAQHSWDLLGALGGDAMAVNASIKTYIRRRRNKRIATATAACCALALAGWAYRPVSVAGMFADASTSPGEARNIRLEDGTQIALNGATTLDWSYSANRREVKLGSGEAYFDVAHNAQRPFYVLAGNARIRVTGTHFSVRRSGSGTMMQLAQGRVLVSNASKDEKQGAIPITPGQHVVWDKSGTMHVGATDIAEIGSWRQGQVIFRAQPLADVLDELNLYWQGRIIVLGDIARLKVSGAYRPDDFERTLSGLEQSLPIRITRFGPLIFVRAKS
jgi:transmembrane sensor